MPLPPRPRCQKQTKNEDQFLSLQLYQAGAAWGSLCIIVGVVINNFPNCVELHFLKTKITFIVRLQTSINYDIIYGTSVLFAYLVLLFQWKEEKVFLLEKVGDELDPVSIHIFPV